LHVRQLCANGALGRVVFGFDSARLPASGARVPCASYAPAAHSDSGCQTTVTDLSGLNAGSRDRHRASAKGRVPTKRLNQAEKEDLEPSQAGCRNGLKRPSQAFPNRQTRGLASVFKFGYSCRLN
jgi:hypothetical protein